MAMPEMQEVKDLALKYDKPTLGRMAQMGQVSPTIAIMAGMMRDRIVQAEMKPPSPPTVAQEVMQPMGQRMGLAAAAQPQAPQQPRPQGQGLNQVPVPPQMFERQGMASGGIVAFQAGGGARGRLDPRVAALLQQNPGMTVPQAVKLLSRMGPAATFSAGLAATDALMATDKGVGQAAAMGSGYDYGPEVMAGGRPDIPVESVGTREQGPGFTDYLRAVGLAPREQVMDPATGKFVDVPPKPIFESATPGLAGVKDQTDVEKRLAEAEAGRGPDVERNSERAEVAEARRQDLLKQAADETKKAEEAKPTAAKPAAEEGETEKPKTYDDYVKEVMDRMGKSTVGAEMRKDIEKDRAARKEAKQEAMWLSLVEAGLGIMGGESPYAAVNIGKGANSALKSYADRLREQKKLDREDRKILLDLERAERAEQRDNYKLASELYSKSLDRMSAEKRSQISADAQRYAADVQERVGKMAYGSMGLKSSTEATIRNNAATNAEARLLMDDKFREAQKRKDQAGMMQRRNELFLEELRKLTPGGGAGLSASGPVLDYTALMGIK